MKALSKVQNLNNKIVLGAGMLLRLFYVVFSTIYDRQYDIGMIDLDAGHPVTGGHLGYIQYLYENLKLPDADPTTVYQFHHPPLNHYMSALWMKLVSLFTHDSKVIEESIQIVPFICSLIILYAVYRILDDLKLQDKGKTIVLSIFSFHPALILLSGSVNNDCMSLMFTFLVVLYAIRWISSTSYKDIILTALFLGLGMSTKQNVAEMAFPLGIVFVYFLVKRFDKKLIGEYLVFLVVSVPLGMWFFIRNLVKYDMSMLWVYELPKDSWQYTGNVPVLYRFTIPVPGEMIDNLLHFRIGCGYNVWMQIMRTSVLGEWDMASAGKLVKVMAILLMLMGAIIALTAFISMIKVMILKLKLENISYVFLVATYLIIMLFYFVFVYKYPQECSMNYRYIEITLLTPAIALGHYYNDSSKLTRIFVNVSTIAFAILSVLMINIWCFGNC